MSDKAKIREMKIGLVMTPEVRACLQQLIAGHTDEVCLDDVFFRHLKIEHFKVDGLKVEDFKLKKGCIRCFKICAIAPEC